MSTQTKVSGRKRVAAIVAVVLVLAIVLGGTYAWQSMNAAAINAAQGETSRAGGRLHDDYQLVGETYAITAWNTGVTANKDIYVENYQTIDEGGQDIFVRLKLYEYMEIGAGAKETPVIEDLSNPGTHIANPAYAVRTVAPLVGTDKTDRDDPATWTPRIPDDDPDAESNSDKFRAYWTWDQGGSKTYMPTFNRDNHSEETDTKGAAVDPVTLSGTEQHISTKIGGADEYSADAGEHDYFEAATPDSAATHTATEKYWDETLNSGAGDHAVTADPVTHTAKATQNATIKTMAEWKALPTEEQSGDYWVLDADGWCYWANPLEPEAATGLLLNNITLSSTPDNNWWYGVYVKSQMATADDWTGDGANQGFYADENEMPSTDAEALLYAITGLSPVITGLSLPAVVAVAAGDTLDMNTLLTITTENASAEWREVVWSIAEIPQSGGRMAGDEVSAMSLNFDTETGIFTPTSVDAGKLFKITATATKDETKVAESIVYVSEAGKDIITTGEGADKTYYVDNGDNTYQAVSTDGRLDTAIVCPVTEGAPGAASDRPVTVMYGQRTLPYGDGLHYYVAGADGKLGVALDDLMYDDGGTLKPSEAIATLIVTPAANEVTKGKTLGFTATATHDGLNVVSGVTWSIEGAHNTSTTISGTGANATLTVASSESASSLTIRATLTGLGATAKDVPVTVKRASVIPPVGTTTFTDGNITWRILKDNRPASGTAATGGTSAGDGTVLLVTNNAYDSYRYTGTGSSSLWVQYVSASIKGRADMWYVTNVSATLKAEACVPTLKYESNEAPDPSWSGSKNDEAGISTPGGKAGSTTAGVVFPLSISEANRYLGADANSKIANSTGGAAQSWWLRSAGSSAATSGSIVSASGNVSDNNVGGNMYALRPALWVDTTP